MMNIQQRDCQTSDTSWKQSKKEKKAARKNRMLFRNKRHENHNNSNMLMDPNNPAEENNDNVLKSGILSSLLPYLYICIEKLFDNSDFFNDTSVVGRKTFSHF